MIHLAAYTSVIGSMKNPEYTNQLNISGSIKVFQTAITKGVKKVILASTSAVYGELAKSTITEHDPTHPISPYGMSKLTMEQYAHYFALHSDTAFIPLRFFNAFGPRQDANSDYAAAIPIFIAKGLAHQPLTIFGDGNQTRDFIYVANIAQAILQAAQYSGKPINFTPFNIGSGTSISILELVNTLTRKLDNQISQKFLPARKGEILHSGASITKSIEFFGDYNLISFEEGLSDTIDYFKAQLLK